LFIKAPLVASTTKYETKYGRRHGQCFVVHSFLKFSTARLSFRYGVQEFRYRCKPNAMVHRE
jgi:hypothetical protein